MLLGIIITGFIALIFSSLVYLFIKRQDSGDEKMRLVSHAIREGAMAFLNKEYKILAIFVLITFGILAVFLNIKIAVAFVLGAILSALAGNIGMRIATLSNSRTAQAVKKNIISGLNLAFSSGSVMGMTVVGFGILGITLLYLIFKNPQIIYGFGFGASAVAIFARVGGGIYTKAADIGADLVGKVEAGIPEDDPRNPAVIADNVGDNVGDVAGMGADLFESYVDSIIAAMMIGILSIAVFGANAVLLPLILAGAGVIASLIGILATKVIKSSRPQKILNSGIFIASMVMILFIFLVTEYFSNDGLKLFLATTSGLIAGLIIGLITEYFTSSRFNPTRKIAEASKSGAATNIISGLSAGMKSTLIPVLTISAVIIITYKIAGIYGIALAAVGMLSTLGITLATDCYGPVADNAAGIAQMSNLGVETRQRAEMLDAVGNTTAAIGKGFAIGSAALTALVLLISYFQVANLQIIDLNNPFVLVGILIGGLLPFLFSSLAMESVNKTAIKVVTEVRRQFREIKGLMEGRVKADYAKCVEIVTAGALKQMIAPGLIAILAPVLCGLILGKEALGGLLIGSVVSGLLLAVMMANSGGAWDNAKKFIEEGNFGGKGSDTHKAAVVGDTVGDPFKDTAGPSLNILIKLISIIAIIIAPLL